MPQLNEFLQELASNADLKGQFDADQTACMQAYGLGQHDIDLVNEGDVEKLKAHLGEDVVVYSHQIVLSKN